LYLITFSNFVLLSAFNKTIGKLKKEGKRLEEFAYENKEIKDEIYDAMDATEFLGVSVSLV